MQNNRLKPTVNAGSMADIAFLLLIFFLVTTTITTDQGINRTLPKPCPDGMVCEVDYNDRNILRIAINNNNQLLVNELFTEVSNLKFILMEFIDNNGDSTCDYCLGNRLPFSSDNPNKAAISIQTTRDATYNTFISVQDELTAAYFELRADYALKQFKKPLKDLSPEELNQVKRAYPFRISEAQIK